MILKTNDLWADILMCFFVLKNDVILRKNMRKKYRGYLKSQYYCREDLEELQTRKLRDLLADVVTNVPYYRDTLNLNSVQISRFSINDLKTLPVLTKELLKSHTHELKNTSLPDKRFIKNSTSGSTGEATYFYSDKDELPYKIALHMRQHDWMGIKYFAKQFWVWGSSFNVFPSRIARLKQKIKRKVMVSSYKLSESDIDKTLEDYEYYKPILIGAYPSHLYHIASYAQNIKHSPVAISLSGEMLYDYQKQEIEEKFKAPVFNYYGARDGSMVAMECSCHDGLHIFAEHVIVEILDDNDMPIEEGIGRVVITQLNNYAMPLIRYEIGDYAEIDKSMWDKCKCGRTLPRIKRIIGRSFDLITFPNGNKVGGTFWTFLMKSVPGIKDFFVHQSVDGKISIEYSLDHNQDPDIDFIKSKILEYGGNDTQVEMIKVKEVSNNTKAGKKRFVVSDYRA